MFTYLIFEICEVHEYAMLHSQKGFVYISL